MGVLFHFGTASANLIITYPIHKLQALEKYKYEQSLEHTGWFIEKLEKELEEYHEHVAQYKKGKDLAT